MIKSDDWTVLDDSDAFKRADIVACLELARWWTVMIGKAFRRHPDYDPSLSRCFPRDKILDKIDSALKDPFLIPKQTGCFALDIEGFLFYKRTPPIDYNQLADELFDEQSDLNYWRKKALEIDDSVKRARAIVCWGDILDSKLRKHAKYMPMSSVSCRKKWSKIVDGIGLGPNVYPDYSCLVDAWLKIEKSEEYNILNYAMRMRIAMVWLDKIDILLKKRKYYNIYIYCIIIKSSAEIIDRILNSALYFVPDSNMGYYGSIDFFKMYSVSGRADIKTFWIWFFGVLPLYLMILMRLYFSFGMEIELSTVNVSLAFIDRIAPLFLLFPGIPYICVLIRRLHDMGRSGLWVVPISVIDFILPCASALFFYGRVRGDIDDNKYGYHPLKKEMHPHVALYFGAFGVIFILGSLRLLLEVLWWYF